MCVICLLILIALQGQIAAFVHQNGTDKRVNIPPPWHPVPNVELPFLWQFFLLRNTIASPNSVFKIVCAACVLKSCKNDWASKKDQSQGGLYCHLLDGRSLKLCLLFTVWVVVLENGTNSVACLFFNANTKDGKQWLVFAFRELKSLAGSVAAAE